MLKRETNKILFSLTDSPKYSDALEKLENMQDMKFNEELLRKVATALMVEFEIKNLSFEDFDKLIWFLKLAKVLT
jgi:hypothetical protein